jgi:hypothetical protein
MQRKQPQMPLLLPLSKLPKMLRMPQLRLPQRKGDLMQLQYKLCKIN